MGCTTSADFGPELEYALEGPNSAGFQDSVDRDGVYTFGIDVSNSWSNKINGETDTYLYALPPLSTKVKSMSIRMTLSLTVPDVVITEAKICLGLMEGSQMLHCTSLSEQRNDSHDISTSFGINDPVVHLARPGCRYKLLMRANGLVDTEHSVSVSHFQISLTSTEHATAAVRSPFEERHTATGAYVLTSPRPWCWGSTRARSVAWVSTPQLGTGTSKIVASFEIDLEPKGPGFTAASLDLMLIRSGKIIESQQILFVNQLGMQLAVNKPLQHSIDSSSTRASRRILEAAGPGDVLVVGRKIASDDSTRFIVKKFCLELHPAIPGTPCCAVKRAIVVHAREVVMESTEDMCECNLLDYEDTLYQDSTGHYAESIGETIPMCLLWN